MKKILYIDMDDVIADFGAAIKEVCPNLEVGDGFPNYLKRKEEVRKICLQNHRIFLNLKPIKDSIDSVKLLSEHFEIYFLSTPMWDLPESYTDKRLWLEKHFGEFAKDRLILTNRKDLNIGDYLIDDRTKNGADKFKGVFLHFGTAELPNWNAILEYFRVHL